MPQSKVREFYSIRKSSRIRNKVNYEETNQLPDCENVKSISPEEKIDTSKVKAKIEDKPDLCEGFSDKDSIQDAPHKTTTKRKGITKKPATKKTSKKGSKSSASSDQTSQTKVDDFYKIIPKCTSSRVISQVPNLSICKEEDEVLAATSSKSSDNLQKPDVEVIKSNVIKTNLKTIQSPKRNLTNPNVGTPPKKKTNIDMEDVQLKKPSPFKKLTPKKLFSSDEDQVSKSVEDKVIDEKVEVKKTEKIRSEETQKAIANFKEKLALLRNYETNPYKVTAVISPAEQEKKSAIPPVSSYERYKYSSDPEFLVLPHKYKLLLEMFRSMETVVMILHNRKEKITFEKVKEGVQKMVKRNFSKEHLGQIVTVMPTAFDVKLEKNTFKKAKEPDYNLIIYPAIKSSEGGSSKSKSKAYVTITPQDSLNAIKEFQNNLLDIVKNHHKIFLSRMNFPDIPSQKITRWHPKFQVDNVPDVEIAALPEIPEVKISTAKDILSKLVKGSMRHKDRLIKAVKSVADETPTNKKLELETSSSKQNLPDSKTELKNVCADLLARIREKETGKLLECMTVSPEEVKRKAMLERLPKIIQILWHYFIAERKAAIHVDAAVEKIIHSCNSLSTHEEVKEHLSLITETCPGWLSFSQMPKGLFIMMNRSRNINEMLNNLQC